jgi:hypothetical protein
LSVREPATSCTTCGAALLPTEVLYDRRGEVVCLACFGEISGASRAPVHSSWWGRGVAVLSPQERRGSILRWSLLFAILAASTVQVRHFALIRLHMICPPVSIDAPLAGAFVPSHLVVRGHVTGSAATRPLWLLAGTIGGCAGYFEGISKPIIVDPFGAFTVAMELPGARRQPYVLQVVSVDPGADGWLTSQSEPDDSLHQGAPGRRCHRTTVDRRSFPVGTAVLSSAVVFLAEDRPASSVGLGFEDGFGAE